MIEPQPDWTEDPKWSWFDGGAWVAPTGYGGQFFVPPEGYRPAKINGHWEWVPEKKSA